MLKKGYNFFTEWGEGGVKPSKSNFETSRYILEGFRNTEGTFLKFSLKKAIKKEFFHNI